MALTITTTITVNDDEAYTAREAAILAAIAAHPSNGAAAASAAPAIDMNAHTSEAANARIAEAKAKAAEEAKAKAAEEAKAKTAAAAKAKTAAAAKAKAAEEAAAEPAEDTSEAEALVAAVEEALAGDAPTLADAVSKATDAISAGKQAQVKAALNAAGGAKRVSELKGDAIATFISALAG